MCVVSPAQALSSPTSSSSSAARFSSEAFAERSRGAREEGGGAARLRAWSGCVVVAVVARRRRRCRLFRASKKATARRHGPQRADARPSLTRCHRRRPSRASADDDDDRRRRARADLARSLAHSGIRKSRATRTSRACYSRRWRCSSRPHSRCRARWSTERVSRTRVPRGDVVF